MEDRQHINFLLILVHHINDAVIAVNHLSNRLITNFWHYPTLARETLMPSKPCNQVLLKHLRIVGGSNTLVICDDCIELVLGLFGKSDLSHNALLGLIKTTPVLELRLDLVDGYRFSFTGLGQANLDLVEEDESLDGIFDRSVLGQFLNGANNLRFCTDWQHLESQARLVSDRRLIRPRPSTVRRATLYRLAVGSNPSTVSARRRRTQLIPQHYPGRVATRGGRGVSIVEPIHLKIDETPARARSALPR
jgi:hypothetical protein